MSFEFGTKADYEKGMFTTTWTWWPEDTLDSLDLLLVYLGVNSSILRPKVFQRVRKDSQIQARLHRALHDKALRSATELIAPGKVTGARREMCWYVTPTRDTKGRLAGAGIDINTCLVIDARRWAFAWQQVTTSNKINYNSVTQEKLVNSDYPTPIVAPIVKHVNVSFAKGRPSKVSFKFEKKNNFVWEDGKKIYDPKLAASRQENYTPRAEDGGPPL